MKANKMNLLLLGCVVAGNMWGTAPLPAPNAYEAADQYLQYPWRTVNPPAQTPAPEGYTPFHMEHYGRHGARWIVLDFEYTQPAQIMQEAHDKGKLTTLGEEVYRLVADQNTRGASRRGDLTEIGAEEHRAIAKRMAANYPEIFADGNRVEARSSVKLRCIISMLNELTELKGAVPGLDVNFDASEADMAYMVPEWSDTVTRVKQQAYEKYLFPFQAKHMSDGKFLKKLFNDQEYAKTVPLQLLADRLIVMLGAMQSHPNAPWLTEKVFSPEEIHHAWLKNNAIWFFEAGNTPMTKGLVPFQKAATLRNIIASADTAVVSPRSSANLRFGHDGIVIALATLMEFDNLWEPIDSLEQLEGRWHDYKLIPTACNIQMVFYRPEGEPSADNVLVKVMLNEKEVKLPVAAAENGHPYYRWTDLRRYYLNKLDSFKQ
ncbi:MAG: histidine-type phosphatase [Muribaculum sp.]|nr:histidine-type phosphatase [Muribaculaceae bacterium]MCM1080889.1 histidine-type phosphatase [Muribaculum sp.]